MATTTRGAVEHGSRTSRSPWARVPADPRRHAATQPEHGALATVADGFWVERVSALHYQAAASSSAGEGSRVAKGGFAVHRSTSRARKEPPQNGTNRECHRRVESLQFRSFLTRPSRSPIARQRIHVRPDFAAILFSFMTRVTPHVGERAVAALEERLRSQVPLASRGIAVFPRPQVSGTELIPRRNGLTHVAPLIRFESTQQVRGFGG